MKRLLSSGFASVALVMLVGVASAAPVLTSLSAVKAARSGRIVLTGTGFGAKSHTSKVRMGGTGAWVTRWTDTRIVAYVPERAPIGRGPVQVFVGDTRSNPLPLVVEDRVPDGRVRWRFAADSDYITQRPAVGPDGSVVVQDSSGFAYGLTSTGGLKWIVRTPGSDGPPSIGPDGTTYLGAMNSIYAINPNGSRKWRFTEPSDGQGLVAGPTVGPDGNIYAATDLLGLGAFSLTPSGALRWSNVGNPVIEQRGQMGAEVVFGPSASGGAADRLYLAFDAYTTAPQAQLYAFGLDGSQGWARPLFLSKDMFMQRQNQPTVGPDGAVILTGAVQIGSTWSLNRISPADGSVLTSYFPAPGNGISPASAGGNGLTYIAQSLSYLEAVDARARKKWSFFDGSLFNEPMVSPQSDVVCVGGVPNFGMPGFMRAFEAARGGALWSLDLGIVNGGNQIPYTRPRFSADGGTVYFGTAVLGPTPGDEFCYAYAVATR